MTYITLIDGWLKLGWLKLFITTKCNKKNLKRL